MDQSSGSNKENRKAAVISADELLEAHPEWEEGAKQLIKEQQAELQTLKAENERLRKAILAQRSKGPKMSTKLRDALYE